MLGILFWPNGLAQAGEHWQQVGTDGLGDADNTVVVTMETWSGAIYAGVANYVDGARIYRSTDGNTWTKVNLDGFGHGANLSTIVDFESFGGQLYATTDNEVGGGQPGEIWSTADGTTWTQAGTDGLGHNHNVGFFHLASFGGQLYTGSSNGTDGGEIYRTADGTTWNLVAATAAGFGDANNTIIWSLVSFGGWLWAGTFNPNGAQVWRSANGTDWNLFLDYAALIPPAPQFTTVNNLIVFNDTLFWFARSAIGAQIIKRVSDAELQGSLAGLGDANNDALSENTVISGVLGYFGSRNIVTGGELWYSADGLNAAQIGEDGFGDANNFAIYALTYQNYLYIGFSNDVTGIQIWRRYFTSTFFGIAPKTLPSGQQGTSYSSQLESTGGSGPYNYRLAKGALPAGLELNSQTGEISGTPQESGDFEFIIEVRDSSKKVQQAQRIFLLTIVAGVAAGSRETGLTPTQTNLTILPETGPGLPQNEKNNPCFGRFRPSCLRRPG